MNDILSRLFLLIGIQNLCIGVYNVLSISSLPAVVDKNIQSGALSTVSFLIVLKRIQNNRRLSGPMTETLRNAYHIYDCLLNLSTPDYKNQTKKSLYMEKSMKGWQITVSLETNIQTNGEIYADKFCEIITDILKVNSPEHYLPLDMEMVHPAYRFSRPERKY